MKVRDLAALLLLMPQEQEITIQDQDGDAVLVPNGVWVPMLADEPVQLTTKEA